MSSGAVATCKPKVSGRLSSSSPVSATWWFCDLWGTLCTEERKLVVHQQIWDPRPKGVYTCFANVNFRVSFKSLSCWLLFWAWIFLISWISSPDCSTWILLTHFIAKVWSSTCWKCFNQTECGGVTLMVCTGLCVIGTYLPEGANVYLNLVHFLHERICKTYKGFLGTINSSGPFPLLLLGLAAEKASFLTLHIR